MGMDVIGTVGWSNTQVIILLVEVGIIAVAYLLGILWRRGPLP
jgi:hypothetical protein